MHSTWTNRRVLIVEDDAIVAMTLVSHLEDCGAEVLGPAPSLEAALATLDVYAEVDGAVLDVELGSEKVWPLALELRNRGIPFVFATGSVEDFFFPPALLTYPRFVKPYLEEEVADALRDLIENEPEREPEVIPAE